METRKPKPFDINPGETIYHEDGRPAVVLEPFEFWEGHWRIRVGVGERHDRRYFRYWWGSKVRKTKPRAKAAYKETATTRIRVAPYVRKPRKTPDPT